MADRPLPAPGSEELRSLVGSNELRLIYSFLYARRDRPPTSVEIVRHLEQTTGKSASQRGRRVRDLYRVFDIRKTSARPPGYLLAGWSSAGAGANVKPVSRVNRARVLSGGRCAFCGKTVAEDHVKLVVDHKLPREWGGSNDLDNLQPLCDECNSGKKAWFSSVDGEAVRRAAAFEEPHRRIGELLKANLGEYVSGDLIEGVASRLQYQEDWQKRTRELRTLGWDIRFQKRKIGRRVRVSYGAWHFEPWPTGKIATEIRRIEHERKSASKAEGE